MRSLVRLRKVRVAFGRLKGAEGVVVFRFKLGVVVFEDRVVLAMETGTILVDESHSLWGAVCQLHLYGRA